MDGPLDRGGELLADTEARGKLDDRGAQVLLLEQGGGVILGKDQGNRTLHVSFHPVFLVAFHLSLHHVLLVGSLLWCQSFCPQSSSHHQSHDVGKYSGEEENQRICSQLEQKQSRNFLELSLNIVFFPSLTAGTL